MVLIVSIVEYTPTIISPACGAFFGIADARFWAQGFRQRYSFEPRDVCRRFRARGLVLRVEAHVRFRV